MAHVSTTEQGSITSVSTQLSQEFRLEAIAGNLATTESILTRGAPRILVYVHQLAGSIASTVSVQASISDSTTGGNAQKWIEISRFLAPPLVETTVPVILPSKFCRVRVTAPAGDGFTMDVAIMAAQ